MAEAPIVSTLIPTYRRPKLLERAIKSALGQAYPHVRVCVFDDVSGDETEETVRRLSSADPRVKYFCHANRAGVYKNFKYAMEHVDTPFFSILSDDDILLPEFYEIAIENFKKYPEAMMSATTTVRMDQAGRVVHAPLHDWKPGLYRPPDGFLSMVDRGHPDWTSVVFRQDVISRVGVLDEETGAPSDLDYLLRVAANFPMVVSNEPGAIFIEHPGGVSSTPKIYTSGGGWLKMIENQAGDERVPIQARTHAKITLTRRLTRVYLANGFDAIIARHWDDFREATEILRRDFGLSMCRDFRLWIKASFLSAAGWACEHLPLAHRVLVIVRDARRYTIRLRKSPLQKRFGYYSKYL